MSECIIIVLQGGIGNQLFQYCAGLSLASSLGGELWLTPTEQNIHSGRDYRDALYIRAKAIRPGSFPLQSIQIQKDIKEVFEEWTPDTYSGYQSISLRGYFQYLPSIESQIALVRDDLFQRLSHLRISLRQKHQIQNPRQTCFLHVRRGDYLKLDSQVFWVQDVNYFLPAIQAIKRRVSGPRRWLVLSDDIEWCKQQPWLTKHPFEIVDEKDELAGLMLMSLCEGGAVISNSTFSWWGAMLGCGATGVPVAYPAKWIGKENPDLFPPSWIRI